MKGINGHIYYDLDQYINVQKFNSLYNKICYGIAMSEQDVGLSYIKCISSFFNNNDYHGSDVCEFMCFSIRIDGIFTKSFREKLSLPKYW